MPTIKVQVQGAVPQSVTLTSLTQRGGGAVSLSPGLPLPFAGPDTNSVYSFPFADVGLNLTYSYGFRVVFAGGAEVDDTGWIAGATSSPNAGVIAVKTAIYRQVVNLLQGWGALFDPTASNVRLVRPGNIVRLDTQEARPPKLTMNEEDGDFPKLIVAFGPWSIQGDGSTPRYGDQLGGKPSGRVKTLTLGFRLTLTHVDLQLAPDDALDMAVVDALGSAGPTLGVSRALVPFVQRGQIMAQTADVTRVAITSTMKGEQRAETTFSFPVMARWQQDPSPTQTA